MGDQASTEQECPGTGKQGLATYQQGGDNWYVKCPVCGATWAGGSHTVTAHRDVRTS